MKGPITINNVTKMNNIILKLRVEFGKDIWKWVLDNKPHLNSDRQNHIYDIIIDSFSKPNRIEMIDGKDIPRSIYNNWQRLYDLCQLQLKK